jgi:hypothetical protein
MTTVFDVHKLLGIMELRCMCCPVTAAVNSEVTVAYAVVLKLIGGWSSTIPYWVAGGKSEGKGQSGQVR